jgi:glycosyltransferase involved in cell wall biosynthesis
LLPSTAEGLPVAAVEALKHGLAIVSSDIPGMHDVVAHGVNGLRLPVGEADAWVKELDRLFDQPAVITAMRRASWEKAREFDLEAIVSQYEEVLKLKR